MAIKQKFDLIRISKFIFSGGVAAFAEYSAFLLLTILLDSSIVVANITSFIVGFIVSFLLNRSWVFMNKNGIKRQFLYYAILALINLLLSTYIIWIFVDMLSLPGYVAKLIVMVMVAIWNYVLFSKLIFKDRVASSLNDKV